MSRKPIDQQQPSECRRAIWEWIRAHNKENGACTPFRLRDIDVKLDWASIRDYLKGLANAGYLVCTKSLTPKGQDLYSLVNDTGHDAPRVRRDGTPVNQGQGQQYMWNTIRVLKIFSAYDLAFNASTDDLTIGTATAMTYIKALVKAGYLVPRPDNRYMLVPSMWTGPHHPQIQRTKQVYDPNLQRVVWSRIEGGAE